ncbi:hypothetical protein [Gordonia sp. OPL2]|uniref:hypothetical protein n=1 Tax=Gordonia sp. OPL2 TaxID=2486274 RepID=UPI0016550F6D|nr:hypothetical protein [Gordonia sp. OPL2]
MGAMRVTGRMRGVLGRAAVVIAAAVAVVMMSPGSACACTCVPREPAAVVKDSSAVVFGTPVSVDRDGTTLRYRVDVRQSYKQRVPQTITVVTSSSSAACGVPLDVGEERLLVLGGSAGGAAPSEGEWGASLCDNTANLSLGDAVLYAGPSIEPYSDSDDREPQPIVIGAFVAIAALVAVPGAIMWWRVRQRRAGPQSDD